MIAEWIQDLNRDQDTSPAETGERKAGDTFNGVHLGEHVYTIQSLAFSRIEGIP
jgi:hypothetical protein